MTEYTRRHIQAAWSVHVVTASGVFVGFLGLNSVIEGHARAAILWLVVALILDGIDGPIARKLNVRDRIPTIDGSSLDLIVDYFTCTIVPVAFLDQFMHLPQHTVGPLGMAILVSGALWMARTNQETEDRWFSGFPAEWNMIIPTLFLLRANPWVTLGLCALFCVLTLLPFQWAHPVSVIEQRPISLAFMTAWLGSMIWLAIAQRSIAPIRIVLIIAPLWTIFQVIQRYIKFGGKLPTPVANA